MLPPREDREANKSRWDHLGIWPLVEAAPTWGAQLWCGGPEAGTTLSHCLAAPLSIANIPVFLSGTSLVGCHAG